MEIVGGIALVGIALYVYFTIPPESEEIIEARKRFGKVK